MRNTKCKTAVLLLLTCVLTVCFSLPCFAAGRAQKKTVKVGFYDMAGYQNVNDDGTLSGYAYDYMQALSQYAAWNVEYVTGYDWSGCLKALENGVIDLLCGTVKTEGREKVFEYPELSSGIAYSYITVNSNRSDICFEDFERFNGMKVGISRNSARNDNFLNYCDKNGFSVNTVLYDTENQLIDSIKNNEVDAIMTTSNLKIDGMRVVAKYNPQPQYIVTSKGNTTILNELNGALTQLKTDVPNFDDKLYMKYYGSARGENVIFTKEETEYIEQHKKIKVLYDPAWRPIEALDEENTAHGMTIDILNKVSKICGIEFKYMTGNTFDQALSMFKEGQADIFTAITFDYTWAYKNNMLLTQPYLDIPFVTIYKTEINEKRKLALPKGYYITQLMESKADTPDIIYFDTVEQCIQAVNSGKADYTFANTYEADYYLSVPKYRSLNFRTVQAASQQLSVAVSQDADPLLFSIINKSIQGVSSNDISAAIRTHTEHLNDSDFFDIMYTNPIQFFGIILFGIVLLIIIGVVLVFYQSNKKKNIKLQYALAAKSEFLSNMSHDLRTPMNGILGLLNLTLDLPDLTEEVRSNLNGIQDSSKYLLRLINDTLDMSKIESDKLTLNYQTVDASSLVKNIVSYVDSFAKENGVALNVISKNAELEYIKTDPLRLQQIFVNIVSNAIKFTPRGGKVDLIIECLKRENGIAYDRISVKDNGIGMSKDFLPKIFEPFEQENTAATEKVTGTGLGMAIVKKLVEMMGGRIEIKSEKNVGTEVIVWINFERVYPDKKMSSQTNQAQYNELNGKRILLVEDHPLNAKIAVKLLEKKGMIVDHVVNGQLAVKQFDDSKEKYYDAILMDIRMPVMNGLDAAKAIRVLPRTDASQVPIIAMTANAFDEDVRLSTKAGMNAHLAKPIEPQKLYETLWKYIYKK